jgi:hypothetical protein
MMTTMMTMMMMNTGQMTFYVLNDRPYDSTL